MTSNWKAIEYFEGKEAWANGVERCPYEEGSMEAVDWFVGWINARDEDKEEANAC